MKFFTKLGLTTATLLLAQAVLSLNSQAADISPPERTHWMIRVRGLVVGPVPKSHLKLGGDRLKRNDIKINTTIIPELDISYFFTRNISAELILGTSRQKIKGRKDIDGVRVGKVWLLPPTLTLQYHFTMSDKVQPYIGAGVNYTIFYNSKKGELGHVKYKNRFSPAVQAGVDFLVNDHWGVNFDVKKLFLKTKVKIDHSDVKGHVKIFPWFVGAGVSYRF